MVSNKSVCRMGQSHSVQRLDCIDGKYPEGGNVNEDVNFNLTTVSRLVPGS
jgi:hypothetical protein